MSIFRRIKADDSVTESGITAVPGANIAIHAMMSSYYSAGASAYASGNSGYLGNGIYGLGDIQSIHARAYNEAEINQAYIEASGSVGDINVHAAASAEANLYISAGQGSAGSGDIGEVTIRSIGHESSAYVKVVASGGDIGQIRVTAANPNGDMEISAYAYSGDIAGLDYTLRGATASGKVTASAYGGDIGYIRFIANGGSGSAYISAYASAIAADGEARGGDIGDVVLHSRGMSGDYDMYVSADGAVDNGAYLGGGNIGDISIQNIQIQGGSGEIEVRLDAYSGGSIGEIKVRQLLTDAYSSSANVWASAYGYSGGPVVSIGDVHFETLSRRGNNNSAYVQLEAGEDGSGGGNIGNVSIIFNELGGGSSELDFYASAYADANGSGGNIGDIRLVNTGYRGNTYANVDAGKSVGNIYIAMGPGSSNADLNMSGAADVGDITVAMHADNSNATSYVNFYMDSAQSDVGLIQVMGGSFLSNFNINQDAVSSIAGIDLSRYAGSAYIEIDDVDIGTTIRAPQAGSWIEGTSAADEIHLGAGEDEVSFVTSGGNVQPDSIYDLNGSSGMTDSFSFDFSVYQHHAGTNSAPASANPGSASGVMVGDVLRLIDISGGNDILTESGLLAALNGGEYANFNAEANNGSGPAIAVVAAAADDTDWRVFKLGIDGTNADFTSVELLAIVQSNVTLAEVSSVFGI
jgi:hypothetical protein